jgi:hypothetical protein
MMQKDDEGQVIQMHNNCRNDRSNIYHLGDRSPKGRPEYSDADCAVLFFPGANEGEGCNYCISLLFPHGFSMGAQGTGRYLLSVGITNPGVKTRVFPLFLKREDQTFFDMSAFIIYFTSMNTTSAMIRKLIMAPTKSPAMKLIGPT